MNFITGNNVLTSFIWKVSAKNSTEWQACQLLFSRINVFHEKEDNSNHFRNTFSWDNYYSLKWSRNALFSVSSCWQKRGQNVISFISSTTQLSAIIFIFSYATTVLIHDKVSKFFLKICSCLLHYNQKLRRGKSINIVGEKLGNIHILWYNQ